MPPARPSPTLAPGTRQLLEAPIARTLLRLARPTCFAIGSALYFASQGAGRLKWPVIGDLARLLVAAAGGCITTRAGFGLQGVFASQAVALVVYAAVNTYAIAGGAWFGRVGWSRSPLALLRAGA